MKPSPESEHDLTEAGSTEEEMVAHLFGDADDPAAIAAALAESAQLRRDFDDLRRTLELVDAEELPHRDADYGAQVWRRVEAGLGAGPAPVLPFRRRLVEGRATTWLALAAAAVLLLGAGFLLGRLDRPDPSTPGSELRPMAASAATLSERGRERLLAAALSDHLGRSERLLTELSNASDDRAGVAALEPVWASELLLSNRLYRRAAEQAGQKRIAHLLAELEPVLIELAHADAGHSSDERRELQRRVDDRGLLFRVRVTEVRLDASRQTPDTPPDQETI